MPNIIPMKLISSPISALPFSNVGPVSSPAMPGLSVIAPTKVALRGRAARFRGWATIWRHSLVAYAHAMAPQRATYAKYMAANRFTSLYTAMVSGRSSLTLMKPLTKSCTAFNNLTNQILIQPMHAFLRPNSVFMCCIALHPVRVFAIIRVVASNS